MTAASVRRKLWDNQRHLDPRKSIHDPADCMTCQSHHPDPARRKKLEAATEAF
jgi:hypothetical protein